MKRVSLVATVLALGAAIVGVSQPAEFSGEAGWPAPAAQGTSVPSPLPVAATDDPCGGEEFNCWNSCRMGTGLPCDLSATLPNGRWFRVEVKTRRDAGPGCVAGTFAADVTVLVVESDGVTRVGAPVSQVTCAATGDPYGSVEKTILPVMFWQAAKGA